MHRSVSGVQQTEILMLFVIHHLWKLQGRDETLPTRRYIFAK